MKTVVYYMTGTGNSLAIARKLAAAIPGSEVKSLVPEFQKEVFAPDAERVGLVYPAYFMGIPLPIRRLLEHADWSDVKYTFAVVNSGGMPGKSLMHADALIRSKGRTLDAGYHIYMPDNYLPMFDEPSARNLKKRFNALDLRIPKMAETIQNGFSIGIEPTRARVDPFFADFAYPAVYKFKEMDQHYWTTDACNGCGVCAKACPFENIVMKEGKPQWQHHCEMCMRCIHICPQKALQFKKNTQKRWRYRNPEVSVKDLMLDGCGESNTVVK